MMGFRRKMWEIYEYWESKNPKLFSFPDFPKKLMKIKGKIKLYVYERRMSVPGMTSKEKKQQLPSFFNSRIYHSLDSGQNNEFEILNPSANENINFESPSHYPGLLSTPTKVKLSIYSQIRKIKTPEDDFLNDIYRIINEDSISKQFSKLANYLFENELANKMVLFLKKNNTKIQIEIENEEFINDYHKLCEYLNEIYSCELYLTSNDNSKSKNFNFNSKLCANNLIWLTHNTKLIWTFHLNDIQKENKFSQFLIADPYIFQNLELSLICIPIISRGSQIIGILYCENDKNLEFSKKIQDFLFIICCVLSSSIMENINFGKLHEMQREIDEEFIKKKSKVALETNLRVFERSKNRKNLKDFVEKVKKKIFKLFLILYNKKKFNKKKDVT